MNEDIYAIVSKMNWPELPHETQPDPDAVLLKCMKCGRMKELDDFHATNRPGSIKNRHGKRDRCKQCIKKEKATPEAKVVARNANLKANYGMNHSDYEKMLAAQNGTCAICGATDPGSKGIFNIDHCHNTGKVRELLCHKCNIGIGNFKDDARLVYLAYEYLMKHHPVQGETRKELSSGNKST